MSDLKAYAEFILGLLCAILDDCALVYPHLTKEFGRDKTRLRSCVDQHGIRFFLDTMPSYRKHLDQCLDNGLLTASHLCNFGTGGRGRVIPRLFQGLTRQVFDENGEALVQPDVQAVRFLRQLLAVAKKFRIACDESYVYDAVAEVCEVDGSLPPLSSFWDDELDEEREERDATIRTIDSHTDVPPLFRSDAIVQREPPTLVNYPGWRRDMQLVADIVVSHLGSFDPLTWRPRHGPGAVADQRATSYKYDFPHWSWRLERSFPYDLFGVPNWNCGDVLSDCRSDFREEVPAKLISVPKTYTKPRLIASEPVAAQWCQQVIRDFFYTRTQETFLGTFITYDDQTHNGRLALESSATGQLVTLDLSSASDRLSCWLVERVFRRNQPLLRAMRDSRSAWLKQDLDAKSPKYLRLRKYSTMGNATTFPVQSTVFAIMAITACLVARGQRPSLRNIKALRGQVRVFGDDLIVPKDAGSILVGMLTSLHLKVNPDKSFFGTAFRESCGVDAYRGHNVTAVSVLDMPVRARPGSVISTVDVHTNLLERGLVYAANYVRSKVERRIESLIPSVKHGSGAFGWSDLDVMGTFNALRARWNPDRQVLERIGLRLITDSTRIEPSTESGLLQFFTKPEGRPVSSTSTLGHLVYSRSASLKLRWG